MITVTSGDANARLYGMISNAWTEWWVFSVHWWLTLSVDTRILFLTWILMVFVNLRAWNQLWWNFLCASTSNLIRRSGSDRTCAWGIWNRRNWCCLIIGSIFIEKAGEHSTVSQCFNAKKTICSWRFIITMLKASFRFWFAPNHRLPL